MLFERVARPWLFRIGGGDAEAAHEWALRRLASLPPATRRLLRRRYAVSAPETVFGVRFPNPVGLAAGMDKDGVALAAWPALGFGFVEVGTVTWHPQPGNERPRLFRERASGTSKRGGELASGTSKRGGELASGTSKRGRGPESIVNRMGFNNQGAKALADRLATTGPPPVPLGISLGKSKVTPLADAVDDYVSSYRALRGYGDYFAVNVSSPNTPGLRQLQRREHLDALLAALVGEKPILVKVAPELPRAELAEVLAVCVERGAAGVIATNTRQTPEGGQSGRPLTEQAREVVEFVHRQTDGALPVIGVGGIMCADDAARMRDAGASLVQLYTGFVYHGPALVRAAARSLAR